MVLEGAAAFGLDAVAFTETTTLDGYEELLELARKSKVKIFVGLELITDKGQYLCFFPQPERVPEPVQLWRSNRGKPWSASACMPKLKCLRGAVVAARPHVRQCAYAAGDFLLDSPHLIAAGAVQPNLR